MKRIQCVLAIFAALLVASLAGCDFGMVRVAPKAVAPPPVAIGAVAPALPEQPGGDPGPSKSDCTMFGGSPSRNMVNLIDKKVPTDWSVEEKKERNVKWVAELGKKTYGGPVISGGKIFVGTNNVNPRDPNLKGDFAILMAFNEADGKFLWQIAHEYPADDDTFKDALKEGLCSTPIVEGKHLYYVTPTARVICADVNGKVVWTYDMLKELKVSPFHLANCSPLIVDDLVMLSTSNGVNDEGKVVSPKAPSFIAVNKKTGKLVWQSSLPGKEIIEGTWSNPTLAIVNGQKQVLFAGGDCVIYSFDAATGNLVWKCDCLPIRKKGGREIDNYIISTPVVVGERMYVGLGVYPENAQATRHSHFVCLDITKKGDVSPKSYDAKDPKNKGSALVWAFGGPIDPPPPKGRQVYFGRTISTAAVHDGLVYIAEETGYIHCLDANTGFRCWDHDFKASVWGSPYYVDGKVYIGTEDGDIFIFAPSKERAYWKDGKLTLANKAGDKVLPATNMDEVIHSTPVVANGVLYITTRSKLYAIGGK